MHLHRQYEADGHDLQSLLFNFLDELLFGFATDAFVAKQLRITTFDRDSWRIVAEGCVLFSLLLLQAVSALLLWLPFGVPV